MWDYVRLYALLLVTHVESLCDAYTTYLTETATLERSHWKSENIGLPVELRMCSRKTKHGVLFTTIRLESSR